MAEMRDIGLRLYPRQAPRKPAPQTHQRDDRQPPRVAHFRPVRIQIEREVSGKDEEDKDPNRQVENAVVRLVPFSMDNLNGGNAFHDLTSAQNKMYRLTRVMLPRGQRIRTRPGLARVLECKIRTF